MCMSLSLLFISKSSYNHTAQPFTNEPLVYNVASETKVRQPHQNVTSNFLSCDSSCVCTVLKVLLSADVQMLLYCMCCPVI